MVNDRLTQLSSSKDEFDRAALMYNKALHESGYEIYLKLPERSESNKDNQQQKKKHSLV